MLRLIGIGVLILTLLFYLLSKIPVVGDKLSNFQFIKFFMDNANWLVSVSVGLIVFDSTRNILLTIIIIILIGIILGWLA